MVVKVSVVVPVYNPGNDIDPLIKVTAGAVLARR